MKVLRARTIVFLVILASAALILGAAGAETKTFSSVRNAISYLRSNQVEELTLENVRFSPSELLSIKNALPAGTAFHFTSTWGRVAFSDETEVLDLRECKTTVTGEDLEAAIAICPKLTKIDNSKKRAPSNNVMIPLTEKYPDVRFEWVVFLGKGHYCATTATVFTTMNPPNTDKKLTSENMELLRFCPRLKALDLGHNKLTTLDFLKYVPDLELLIIGQNEVRDITPIGQLKHLQYAELFTNPFTDISALANCTELLDLNITNCQVLDFSPLDGIQTLERFWANMIKKLPQEEIDRFRQVHPDTETDIKPSHAATVDGWRKHPRYRHYIWCFKNKTWVPFDEPLPI